MDVLKDKDTAFVWDLLKQIPDPEIPVVSIVDLGVVRQVEEQNGKMVITMTPTYSGCPALKAMEESVREAFSENQITNYEIKMALFPAWTTDWLTEETRVKLRNYGIAPPEMSTEEHLRLLLAGKRSEVSCPFCKSTDTRLTSAFGSTACKALHYCNHCQQPFEEFKCH